MAKKQTDRVDDEDVVHQVTGDSSNFQSDDDVLVPMRKHGETIDVHPTCVRAHEAAGWKLA